MKNFAVPFATVLRYIKDHPEDGCLVHCTGEKLPWQSLGRYSFFTAGKDRTGVFSAILLMVSVQVSRLVSYNDHSQFLGVSDEDIALDYSLTTAGLELFLPILAARFKDKPVFKDHWEGMVKMGSSE
jgi:hypothetical protein